MTKFEGGPAQGTVLSLHRCPHLLRVVRAPDGKIDALDQLDDKPAVDEELFLYRLVENHGMVHINARDKKGKRCGGFYAMAVYALAETQPDQDTMRSPRSWATFAEMEWRRTGSMLRKS